MVQRIVVYLRDRKTSQLIAVSSIIEPSDGRLCKTGEFRYRKHEVVNL